MATVGFKSIYFTIGEKEYVVDAKSGGAINAKITGLGSTQNTIFASNKPFHITSKGVTDPKVELNVVDLMDNGLYQALLGIEEVDGISVIGADTQAPYTSVVMVTESKEGVPMFMGLSKGRFSAPDIEMGTSEDKGQEIKTDTVEGSFIADDRGYVFMSGVDDGETTDLEKFKAFVNNKTVAP